MDFNERIMHSYAPLPFYMMYPEFQTAENSIGGLGGRNANGDNSSSIRDFEYLQQTYPATVKKYQKKISDILDKLDYDGSMIYDEYPDKASIIRLADSIVDILKKQDPECDGIEDIIKIVLCNEIYKRRHSDKKYSIHIFNY